MNTTTPEVMQAIAAELAGVRPDGVFDKPSLSTKEDLPKLDRLNLFGLAFSGGGIRSAAFNLGILQSLERLGLMEYVDYLSTVSGGGYTGSWYLACLKEKLSPQQRTESIRHLRKFSQYLAPAAGFFSVDTWTVVMIWLRNTLQLQTMLACFFGLLLLAPRIGENVFLYGDAWTLRIAAFVLFWASVVYMTFSLRHVGEAAKWPWGQGQLVAHSVASMAMVGSGCYASALWWAISNHEPIVLGQVEWGGASSVTIAALLTARYSLMKEKRDGWWLIGAPLIAIACGSLCYGLNLGLAAFYARLNANGNAPWIAGMTGAPAILIILSWCVVLQIGLLGRAIGDAHREWWSRFGALLVISSVGPFALYAIAVFGPQFVEWLFSADAQHSFSQLVARIASVGGVITATGGVFAARSADTGDKKKPPPLLKNALATAAPFLFIGILLVAVACGIDFLLERVAGCDPIPDYWAAAQCSIMFDHIGGWWTGRLFVGLLAILFILAWRVDINESSMNPFYRNRLVRCFQGAARAGKRRPHPFTGFDDEDDFSIGELRPSEGYRGPVPILNTAVNRAGGEDAGVQERRAASFFFTPYRTGSDYTNTADTFTTGRFKKGIWLGSCMATSGAAASPNMGYHTSPSIAFLLTFFNVRLGLWLRNPQDPTARFGSRWGFYYLLKELFGNASVEDKYIYLSDGGHFENLGVYELVRRRCKYIIVGDGEQDGGMVLDGLGSLVRKVRIDFDVQIDIDTAEIRALDDRSNSRAHCAVGKITYPDCAEPGYLIYLKSSMTGDEPSDLLQYRAEHTLFPHESTLDQFFSESQFESYRRLGEHVADKAFRPALRVTGRDSLGVTMEQMEKAWVAGSPFTKDNFAHHAEKLDEIWKAVGSDADLRCLGAQLFSRSSVGWVAPPATREGLNKQVYFCQSIIQLMENVYIDLRLETEDLHPDNEGWMRLFRDWARSPDLQAVFRDSQAIYGSRFRNFWERELTKPHS